MGQFNLLDEPWICIVCDDKGTTKEVSMLELFENAAEYSDLAGDTKTQDFAVLRVLLAALHTVFSRVDAQGIRYECFELDDKYIPTYTVDLDDVDDGDYAKEYGKKLKDTWADVWEKGEFPEVVGDYLRKWHERFFLFDDKYPFFQVTENDISSDLLNRPAATEFSGKTINRLISESNNKLSLFSPKNEAGENHNKEILSEAEIARWLITLQGYVGLSDKVIFGKKKYKASKGWLFDIGGLYLKGRNLFETLWLNCYLPCEKGMNLENIQTPCWEKTGADRIKSCLRGNDIYNLAELYTAWSRAVYIDPECDTSKPFSCKIVKLPEIEHKDNFLEPMTIWHLNKSGENKDKFTPKKHIQNRSLWRSFGVIGMGELDNSEDKRRCPGIIDWLNEINAISRDKKLGIDHSVIGIASVSMMDDGNATSWVPTDEIVDFLSIGTFVLTDVKEGGWLNRINDTIDKTKNIVEGVYKNYIIDIKNIRRISSDEFVSQQVEQVYFLIDKSFRQWLAGLKEADDKDKKISEWESVLKEIVRRKAEEIFNNGSPRDLLGIEADGRMKNIAVAFNNFMIFLNAKCKKGGKNGS